MRRTIAVLVGFLAFGLVGYVGGQVQNQQSETIQRLQSRIESLEHHKISRADCACIRLEKGSREIEVGGIRFYLVPVTDQTGKGKPD
ncbi:MAG: hypothetical protein ACE15E_12265 [Acidobacteriota bacterium]